MKVAAILLVCAFVHGNNIELNEVGCPRDYNIEKLYPHESCNKYYQCTHGQLIERICFMELQYNVDTQQCDWPNNIDCGNRIIPDANGVDNGSGNGSGNGDNIGNNNENSNNGNGIGSGVNGNAGNNGCNCNCNCPDPNENGNGDGNDNGNGGGDNGGGDNGDGDCNNGNGNGDNGNGNGDNGDGNGGNDGSCNCNPGEAPLICSRPGSEGELVAHEKCNKFYKCSHGIPVPQVCYGILLYNPYKEICDWPQNVDCGDRIIPDPNEGDNDGNGGEGNGDGNGDSGNGNGDNGDGNGGNDGSCNCNPGEAPSICNRPGSEGELVAHEKCNKFYKCSHGIPVPQVCYGILLYNPYKGVCDWPQNVDCGDRIIPDPNEGDNDGNGGEGNGDGNGDGGNGNGDNGDGNENGGGDCDNTSNEGDSNGNGNGSENSSNEENIEENGNGNNNGTCYCDPAEAIPICKQHGSDGIHVAHEHCTKYYRCFFGEAIPQRCPKGLHFNPYLSVCDWPRDVNCADRIIPEDDSEEDDSEEDVKIIICNCNPEEAPLICARNNSNSILVANEYCNQYYICDNGVPVVQKCSGNLLYNPHKEVCDWPQDVDCGDRVIPDPQEIDNGGNESSTENIINRPCNCDPDQAEAICAAENSESVLIAHEICNKYYICNYGLPVAQTCQGNLLYNPYKEYCDWSANVDCGNRLKPGQNNTDDSCNCNPSEAPSICAQENSAGIVIAHENCHQYYKCFNNRPMVLSCFNSWLFNPYTKVCESPESVNCGHRHRISNEN